ncbi:MAG: hypothetical protein Q8R48_04180 [Candidatus Omnitrophota bacterium]|nr:hypothetical protein [Candidatus Omnitrophota bacterium]
MNNSKGFTTAELLIAASIAIIVIGGAFALWFMTQDSWINERLKSEMLQNLQITIERIKREIQISDASKIYQHTGEGGVYDAISFPMALDDGRSDTGYNPIQNNDGFLETDSSTYDPITGVSKIYWDKTIIYHIYPKEGLDENGLKQLRRTVFVRDKSLSTAQFQSQIDNVVEYGTGNNPLVPSYANWESTRTIFKADAISFEVAPRLLEFDGYSPTTERTEDLTDFGSTILDGGYHTIKFQVLRKNPDSTGYAFGIDLLKFTPSGSIIEAENYATLVNPDGSSGISGSSGDTLTTVNTHSFTSGVWSNDYYLNYDANAIGDYLTLRFYYDRWYETTFLDGVYSDAIVDFSDRTGVKRETSGDEEYAVRLEGYEETWHAFEQIQDLTPEPVTIQYTTLIQGWVYKNLIRSDYNKWNGMQLRVKFMAGNEDSGLEIEDVSVIPEDGSGPWISMTFGGSASVTIPKNEGMWSDWVQLKDVDGNNMGFDKGKSYYISFTPNNPSAMSSAMWGTDATSETNSYTGPLQTEDKHIYAVSDIEVTYTKQGSFTSKIFDTGVEAPDYGTLTWTMAENSPDADMEIKIRTAGNEADLEADGMWSSIPGLAFTASPASLGALSKNRYVQFKANLTASAGGSTLDDYDKTSILKDVSIYWPGNTTMVDTAGYFTKRPDYGVFTVEIDGQKLVKGFEIKLSLTEQLTTGSETTRSINAEVEPRNTNK